jgi:hypothetical protein
LADDPAAYLGADEVIQSDDPEIVLLAKGLHAGAPDDVAFTKAPTSGSATR